MDRESHGNRFIGARQFARRWIYYNRNQKDTSSYSAGQCFAMDAAHRNCSQRFKDHHRERILVDGPKNQGAHASCCLSPATHLQPYRPQTRISVSCGIWVCLGIKFKTTYQTSTRENEQGCMIRKRIKLLIMEFGCNSGKILRLRLRTRTWRFRARYYLMESLTLASMCTCKLWIKDVAPPIMQ